MADGNVQVTVTDEMVERAAKFDWERDRKATEENATRRQPKNLSWWGEAWSGEQDECRAEMRDLLAAALDAQEVPHQALEPVEEEPCDYCGGDGGHWVTPGRMVDGKPVKKTRLVTCEHCKGTGVGKPQPEDERESTEEAAGHDFAVPAPPLATVLAHFESEANAADELMRQNHPMSMTRNRYRVERDTYRYVLEQIRATQSEQSHTEEGMKFADEEHLRRHTRKGVKTMHERLDQALSFLEDGDLESAVDSFDSAEAEASSLSRNILDWPTNRAGRDA